MYRYCIECRAPRWWPDAHVRAPCGHLLEAASLLGCQSGGRCDPAALHVILKRRGGLARQSVAVGTVASIADGIAMEARLSSAGVIAVRFLRTAGEPGGGTVLVPWVALGGSRQVSTDGQGDGVGFVADLDLAVPPLSTRRGGERESLVRLEVGVSIDVAASEGGTLERNLESPALRLIPREDNCLRAVCLDATGARLNGEPFATELIRPGDIVSTARYAWRWSGLERGFVQAPEVGSFEIAAADLSLAKRVRNFTVAFKSGELAAIVGGSGSGKTTLVRMIAGILTPAGGRMTVRADGQCKVYESHQLPQFAYHIQSRVAYIPQDDAVLHELTVWQAVEYAYLLHPSNRGAARTRKAVLEQVASLLQSVGLESHSEKLVGHLSGGQRRRVNLALGLVGDPDLVILDEPTTGLDFDNERRTMQLLRRLAHQGRAVVVVTHSLDALEFADKCVAVRWGAEGAEIAATIDGSDAVAASAARVETLISRHQPLEASEAVALRRDKARAPRPRFVELVARGFRQWINTPVPALLAFIALPLALGIMVRLGSGNFREERLAIGLVAIFWLGINQSVRDLLKDIDVIRREDLDGTSPLRQVLARAFFVLVSSAIGAVVMTVPFHWMSLDGWRLWLDSEGQYTDWLGATPTTQLHWYSTIIAFWAAGLLGGLLGLTIAAACSFARRKAESIAVLVSVLVTLPQFLYSEKCLSSGLARDPEHYDLFFRTWHSSAEQAADWLSFLTVTRWTYLPLEAQICGIEGTSIIALSAMMLGAGAIASIVLAAGLLTISLSIERGAGWVPRQRARVRVRSRGVGGAAT